MPDLIKNFLGPANDSGARRTMHDVRAFFVLFLLCSLIWMIVVSVSVFDDKGAWHFIATAAQLLGRCGLLSSASMILGGLLGFLFGIPRSLTGTSPTVEPPKTVGLVESGTPTIKTLPNTNLEQISDWLTKILVGVGLTQIAKVPALVDSASKSLDVGLLPLQHGGVIGLCIAATYGCGGFVWGYFESRTSLMQVFNSGSTDTSD